MDSLSNTSQLINSANTTVLRKKRAQLLLFIIGIVALSITAEKCRHLVGEEAASKSGKFTLLNCFDGGSGTLACLVKEGVKLYTYSIRSLHVEKTRNKAIESALADALAQGMTAKDAAKVAQKEGAKAAKLATRKAKRILGPIISSGWDFFEALYFGGTMTEGFLRGTGTLFGTYYVGFIGEQRLGRFGYLVGSHLGSWVGGRIGLMMYDVVNGVQYMLQFPGSMETESNNDASNDKIVESNEFEASEVAEDSSLHQSSWSWVGSLFGGWFEQKTGLKMNDVVSGIQEAMQSNQPTETNANEDVPKDETFEPTETFEVSEDSYMYEPASSISDEPTDLGTPADQNYDAHEEF